MSVFCFIGHCSPMPSIPNPSALPTSRSARPYTTFELDHIRQHARRLVTVADTNQNQDWSVVCLYVYMYIESVQVLCTYVCNWTISVFCGLILSIFVMLIFCLVQHVVYWYNFYFCCAYHGTSQITVRIDLASTVSYMIKPRMYILLIIP